MSGGSNVLRFGPFELDPSKSRLFRGPARVPLSQPQAAILVQLVSNVGEILSKNTLTEAAWSDAAVTDNSLDQAISQLRKTLGTPDEGGSFRPEPMLNPTAHPDIWAETLVILRDRAL